MTRREAVRPRGRPAGRRAAVAAVLLLGFVGFPGLAHALAPAGPVSGHAVDRAEIQGKVFDGSQGGPVVGVDVMIRGPVNRTVVTGADGQFRFENLPLGTYEVRTRRSGYAALVDDDVALTEDGQVVVIEFHLDRDAIGLPGIGVEVSRGAPAPGPLYGVYERLERVQARGDGYVWGPQEIQNSGARRVSELLRRVPGAREVPPSRFGQTTGGYFSLSRRETCRPSIYLDGVRLGGEPDLDSLGSITIMEVVEVYRARGTIPGEFADRNAQNCGVVALWTQRDAGVRR